MLLFCRRQMLQKQFFYAIKRKLKYTISLEAFSCEPDIWTVLSELIWLLTFESSSSKDECLTGDKSIYKENYYTLALKLNLDKYFY